MTLKELAEVCRQLDEYLAKGWIKKSLSPYGAPIPFFFCKKEGTFCMCIYFRMLKKQTKANIYPIPQIDEILDHLYQARVFLKNDLSKTYHQVAFELSHMHKTTFLTKYGLLKFLNLSFK